MPDQLDIFVDGAIFRQFDFIRNHREAQSMGAGARRFDRGVERKQIGLSGWVIDDLDICQCWCRPATRARQ